MTVLILDDEDVIVQKISNIIHTEHPEIKILTAHNSREFNDILNTSNEEIDLMFADILLKEEDGISLAELVANKYRNVHITFISGNPEYAKQTIKIGRNINFIKKPIDDFYIRFQIDSIMENRSKTKEIISVNSGKKTYSFALEKIIYIESERNYSTVHLIDDSIRFSAKLSDFTLDSTGTLVRCHQSYIVNLNYISQFNGYNIYLSDGTVISASKARLKDSKEKYFRFKGGM